MCIDHRRLDAAVAQDLLDRPDVVAALQEVGGEGVAQGVAGRVLEDPGRAAGVVKGPLDASLVKVMTPVLATPRVLGETRPGKDVLPSPFAGRPRVFPRQRMRKMNPAIPCREVYATSHPRALSS